MKSWQHSPSRRTFFFCVLFLPLTFLVSRHAISASRNNVALWRLLSTTQSMYQDARSVWPSHGARVILAGDHEEAPTFRQPFASCVYAHRAIISRLDDSRLLFVRRRSACSGPGALGYQLEGGLTVAGCLPLVQPLGMLCLTPMTRCLYSLHFQHTLSDPNEPFWMSTDKKCPYTSIDSVRSRH